MKLKLIFKDNTRPGDTALPDELYGSTGLLDQQLKQSLHTPGNPTVNLPLSMKPMQGQAVNVNLKNQRVNVDVSVIAMAPATKQLANTMGKQQAIALPAQIDRDLNAMIESGQI